MEKVLDKVLDLHSEQCTSYNINFAGEDETLSLDRMDVVTVSFGGTLVGKGNALIEQDNYAAAIQSFDKVNSQMLYDTTIRF